MTKNDASKRIEDFIFEQTELCAPVSVDECDKEELRNSIKESVANLSPAEKSNWIQFLNRR